MKNNIINISDPNFIRVDGAALSKLVLARIDALNTSRNAILQRVALEIASKEEAVGLLVVLLGSTSDPNERAMFVKAAMERAAILDKDIQELKTFVRCIENTCVYQISLQDAKRFGITA